MTMDVKKKIIEMLEVYCDEALNKCGFKRKKNSMIYSRNIGTVKQKVEMVSFLHPSYAPNAAAHIYPWFTIYYPEVNKMAKDIFKNCFLIENLKDITIRQPIQLGTQSERWLLDDSNIRELGGKIQSFLVEYTIPILNKLESIQSYIDMYESNDIGIVMDDIKYIFLICAYVVTNDYAKGKEVLEKRFGKAGQRNLYESTFSYFDTII